jgi:hypothetical protein
MWKVDCAGKGQTKMPPLGEGGTALVRVPKTNGPDFNSLAGHPVSLCTPDHKSGQDLDALSNGYSDSIR